MRGDDDVIVPLYTSEQYAEEYENCTFHRLDKCDHMTICPDERTHAILLDFLAGLN